MSLTFFSILPWQVAAAHLCYLVADANLESYSSNARLCLIGADHCKHPRTFVTPEAIQVTIFIENRLEYFENSCYLFVVWLLF